MVRIRDGDRVGRILDHRENSVKEKVMASKLKPSTIADKLGQVKAQIADLEKVEEDLRQMLVNLDIPEVEGKLFRALVIHSEVTRVDYKGIVEEAKIPPRVLRKHTEVEDRTTVKLVART